MPFTIKHPGIKEFILEHYRTKSQTMMAEELGIPLPTITYWVHKLNLRHSIVKMERRKPQARKRKCDVRNGYFDVNAHENWIV